MCVWRRVNFIELFGIHYVGGKRLHGGKKKKPAEAGFVSCGGIPIAIGTNLRPLASGYEPNERYRLWIISQIKSLPLEDLSSFSRFIAFALLS